jgi:ADP-heptose:LPS heptosyltransferase
LPRFLIIRLSSIGDIVLTTPVVRCLKKQLPDAEIHYLTKKEYLSLVSPNPYIDRIHAFEGNLSATISSLKEEKIDFVIDLHHNLRSLVIKLKLGKPSYSFNKINFQKWLKVYLKTDILPKTHIVDRYLQTLHKFGVKNDSEGLDFFVPEKDNVNIFQLPAELHEGFVVISAGAKHFTKQIPVNKLIEICNQLSAPVIILGGKEDFEKAEEVRKASNRFVLNGCGKYSINQSASLVQQSRAIITADTGLMHIAAAFHKVVISIWGNTIPEFGMSAYLPDSASRAFEVKNLPCRPCSKIGFQTCPKKHFDCMNKQNAGEIATYMNSILN